jgi:hypothetical protein
MTNKYIRDVKSSEKLGGEFEQSGDGDRGFSFFTAWNAG